MIPFFRKRVRRAENQPRRSVRPMLECLEQRLTPSTYTVTDAADTAGSSSDVTLRYAINQALANNDPNAVINFSSTLAGQTITLSQNASNNTYGPTAFVVGNANITIDGANAPGLVVSGGNALRPFAVQSSGSLTLENLTVIDGSAQGGAGGSSDYGGGGGGGAGLGGAVYDDGGNFTAEGVTFYGNVAQGGAGGAGGIVPLYSVIGGGGGGLGVPGQSGSAGGEGGLIGGNGGNSNNLIHTGGVGGFGGGGGGGGGGGYLGNSGVGYGAGGGGFGGGGGGGGSAQGGGAIGGFGGGLGGNGGPGGSGAGGAGGAGMGGALFVNGGTLTLTNDTFTGNTAQGGLGGTGSGGSGSGSNGRGFGGSVFVRNGTMTATFDTFSNNTAQLGTDVFVLSDGSGNQATATLTDDILGQTANTFSDFVALNINSGTAPNLSGSSHDLVRNNGILLTGGIINGVNPLTPPPTGLPSSAVISSADPLLSSLANNGGPTQTMALSLNSPAFQQGIAIRGITTDQRGDARPTNTPSLGAFEPLVTPTPTPPPPVAPNEKVDLLFLAEDQFALTVDTLVSQVTSNPTFTQATDNWIAYWNNRFGLDNPALGTGLVGLQSAIHDNPYYGTIWGQLAQTIGLDRAAAVLTLYNPI